MELRIYFPRTERSIVFPETLDQEGMLVLSLSRIDKEQEAVRLEIVATDPDEALELGATHPRRLIIGPRGEMQLG